MMMILQCFMKVEAYLIMSPMREGYPIFINNGERNNILQLILTNSCSFGLKMKTVK